MKPRLLILAVLTGLLVSGCQSSRERIESSLRDHLPNPSLAVSYQLYRGDGTPADLGEVIREAETADLILFGEHHYQAVCNAVSTELFQHLVLGQRPVVLAMEFFTRDDQEFVDEYVLEDELTEPEFQEATGRKGRYLLSHRPLIELARITRTEVVGAGVARDKWSLWRESGLDDYADWLATLSAEERESFPRECTMIKDAYWDAIVSMSGVHGDGEVDEEQSWEFFRTQCMWDDSFAEAMADVRDKDSDVRLFLVVGAFHINNGLGTITKYRSRRPNDRILTVSMSSSAGEGYDLSFNEEDRGLADYVLYTVKPPVEKKEEPTEEADEEEITEEEIAEEEEPDVDQ